VRVRLWLTSWIALGVSMTVVGLVGSGLLHRATALSTSATPNVADVTPAGQGVGPTAATDSNSLTRDPFRSGGRLPDAVTDEAPAPETALPVSVAAIRLLGTVVRPSNSFALCQLPGDVPRMIHVGEKLGEMTLISIEQGRATFQAPHGGRLDLSLSTPRS
jgi:hypothetical protein